MSRLDLDVKRVRNRLALANVVQALGWAAVVVASIALAAIWVGRLTQFALPSSARWIALGIVGGAGVIAAMAWGIWRRPSALSAATVMDQNLGTKDRFATALYFQSSSDEFAQAARKDAEAAAETVSLRRKFPSKFPKPAYAAIAVTAAAVLSGLWLPSMDLLGHQGRVQRQAQRQQQVASAKQALKQALAKVQSVPKSAADSQVLNKAKSDLEELLREPRVDPANAHRKALEALQSVDQSMRDKIQNSAQFAQLQQQRDMLKSLDAPSDQDNATLKAAREAMKKGNFAQAAQELQKAAEQFQKLTADQKQAMAQQMQAMADQLQQAANDPAQRQQMQKQLQQMGATAEQAKTMTDLLQQAAQGDAGAKQQLQKMADQLAKQAGGDQQQMQQQMQQAMQQMQGKMAANQQAQQMAQAASQMAQAMQQNSKQRLASAGEAMQQQMGQMSALQQDMQQMQAMQQSMQQAAGQQMAAANGNGNGQGKNPGAGSKGQQAAGVGGSRAGTGHAVAPLPDDSVKAVYKTEGEQAPSKTNAKSPVLASYFINAPSIKGESHIKMSELEQAAAQEAAQSVDQQHVPPPVREAVKDYFDFSK